MGDYKKVKQKETPQNKNTIHSVNPNQYYMEKPAWCFVNSDQENWAFTKEHIGELIWTEILPRLKSLETQTWSEILVKNKKQNHSIDIRELNKTAQNRLAGRYIEAEFLISLRLTGNHRIYGYMTGKVFNILWYDDDHGDNNTCVCRSCLKHT